MIHPGEHPMSEITPEERAERLYDPIKDCFTATWDEAKQETLMWIKVNRLQDVLATAIREAENAAYERAAAEARKPKAGAYETRVIISKAIKALKHQSA